jgi:hypothetical protein
MAENGRVFCRPKEKGQDHKVTILFHHHRHKNKKRLPRPSEGFWKPNHFKKGEKIRIRSWMIIFTF